MKKNISITILLILIFQISFAQKMLTISKNEFLITEKNDSGAWKALNEGINLFKANVSNALKAAEKLEKANAYNSEIAKLKYNLGLCYLYSPNKSKAILNLKEAIEMNEFVAKDAYFLLARAYHLNSEFKKAKENYEAYKLSVAPSELPKIEPFIEKYKDDCNSADKIDSVPMRVYIDNLSGSVNSEFNDYLPMYHSINQELYFTSQREETTDGKINKYGNNYFEDIFSVNLNNSDSIETNNLGKLFETKDNEAFVGLSSDGLTAFIYKGLENGGDLYFSTQVAGVWGKIKTLGNTINDKKAKENSATISNDGQTLYFTSDRENGYGGSDIYVSTKDANGKWQAAKNIGIVLNSPKDEINVYLSSDNQALYFASNGFKGFGGFDIYKSEKDANGNWQEPINLGSPINSPTQQMSYFPVSDTQTAFLTSENEQSKGQLDIYKITFLGEEKSTLQNTEDNLLSFSQAKYPKIELLQAISSTLLSGRITSKRTGAPLQAQIEIIDKEQNKIIYSENTNAETGEYEISLPAGKNYSISVKSDSYMFVSDNIEVQKSIKFQRFKRNFELFPLELGSFLILKNVFFDSNSSVLRTESYAELDVLAQFMSNNPSVKLEISGHTDNLGSSYSNKKLSKERSEAVQNYLISIGVDASRLISVGYGPEKPVANNKTPEGRQTNRRVEAKIISIN